MSTKNVINNYFLTIFIVFLIIINSGNCLQCYKCNDVGSKENNCGYNFDSEIIDCIEEESCQKVINPSISDPFESFEPITRGCYNSSLCTELSHCFSCRSDFCNSTSRSKSFLNITIGILFALILFFTC